MSLHLTIAERMEAVAADADAPVATQLSAAAKKARFVLPSSRYPVAGREDLHDAHSGCGRNKRPALVVDLKDDATDERPGATPEAVQTC